MPTSNSFSVYIQGQLDACNGSHEAAGGDVTFNADVAVAVRSSVPECVEAVGLRSLARDADAAVPLFLVSHARSAFGANAPRVCVLRQVVNELEMGLFGEQRELWAVPGGLAPCFHSCRDHGALIFGEFVRDRVEGRGRGGARGEQDEQQQGFHTRSIDHGNLEVQ